MAKGQQETAGDPDAAPEPNLGEEPKRKPMTRGKKDAIKGEAAIERSRRGC